MEETDLIRLRKEKIEQVRELGWNPYSPSYDKTHMVADALKSEGKHIKTAGKILSFREHGNITFADLRDETGKIQIFFKKDLLGKDAYKQLKFLDIGDIIGVEGEVIRTVAGEISVAPTQYTLLTKSVRPLPNQWYGLKDTEIRFRQRYLDLILNPEVRERFNTRSKVISGVREYLDGLGFWEVETPTLQPLYGGANAKPFKTHMNALDQDMYLRIADELYLKRLIIGGYERVYEICKDFRNEGIDHTHFPEFTMIEWYEAYADYHRVMDVAEGLFKHVATKVYGQTKLQIEDKTIDIGHKWPRIEMSVIMKEKLGLDVENETQEGLLAYARKHLPSMQLVGGETKGQLIFAIFDHTIPKMLIEPTWIIDYPEDISPLSKEHRSKPGWVERFEGYIGGKEICDGWSELTDPAVQRKRFTKDSSVVRKEKDEAQQVDEDFLMAMEYGMPPTGGIGIGIDRLTMFFTNTWAIKEVVMFPTLKPYINEPVSVTDGKTVHAENSQVIPFTDSTLFSIDSAVKIKYPSLSIGIAVITGIKVAASPPKLIAEKEEILKMYENLTTDEIGSFSEILSYRKLYKEMGVDWHSRRPSPEALLRRIAQKKSLPSINSCVDSYNMVVMKNRVSIGAFDLDQIVLPTTLRFPKEGESILLLGDLGSTLIKEKELAYFDKHGAYNIDLNYRDAQRTAVTEKTTNILINVDGIFDVSPEKVQQTLSEAVEKIISYCGGKVTSSGVVSSAE